MFSEEMACCDVDFFASPITSTRLDEASRKTFLHIAEWRHDVSVSDLDLRVAPSDGSAALNNLSSSQSTIVYEPPSAHTDDVISSVPNDNVSPSVEVLRAECNSVASDVSLCSCVSGKLKKNFAIFFK